MVNLSHRTFFAAALLAGVSIGAPAMAQAPAGVLECDIGGGVGFVVGSNKGLSCVFHPLRGRPQYYTGSISHVGLDLGATSGGHFSWGVALAGAYPRHYSLAGSYAGPMIGVTVIGGADANALVGGNGAISLQPLAVSTQRGLDVTAGIGQLTLIPAGPVVPVTYYHHRHHHRHYHHA